MKTPDANTMVRLLESFTETFRSFDNSDIAAREVACIRAQLPARVRPIEEEDLFAGRLSQPLIGFTPQSVGSGMGYCIHPDIDELLTNNAELSNSNKEKLSKLLKFWEQNGTVYKSRRMMPDDVRTAIPSEGYYLESGIAFSLYRISGVQMDYHKLLKLGIPGLREELARYSLPNKHARALYEAMDEVLDVFCELCSRYARQASEQAELEAELSRKKELLIMAATLKNICIKAPENFREGLQLMYLYNAFDDAKNYGRMDDYLAELYHRDLQNGVLDDEEAIRLLGGIWKLMKWRDHRYDTRLIIGGRGRHNEARADQVAMLILECTRRIGENVPQVALRFHEDQNPALYQKGLDLLAGGNTYPMLYNDEVNIPAACSAFKVSEAEAEHVIQYGCGEYVLNHRSVGTPSGVINLLQALLITMSKGVDPGTGKHMGMPADRYDKYGDFNEFETLIQAYFEQVEYHVEALALQEYLEYRHAAADNAYLSYSMLMDDCIARGQAIFDGGIRHLGGTLESYGNSNVADSLLAIRELVYKQKRFSLDQLKKMLDRDFEGYELEHRLLLDCPKYGNDHPEADAMFRRIHEHICEFTARQATRVGLDSYLVVIINNDANTVMGTFTPASPDGRKACTYLNPGHNPTGGADRSGVTAFMNSILKADTSIHAGAVVNMKFSKEMLNQLRPAFEALMQVYFKQGGAQAMLNVLSRGELEDAMEHPQNYQNLIVRVGGFSERFVNLPRETQLEVLSRTMN